ncbi:MAG: hypothetical protein GY906_10250 [bacterium]|nr:hypothetical protein [bacterium]
MRPPKGQTLDTYPKTWTKAQKTRASLGLHPTMGEPYLDADNESPHVGPTCGDCRHLQSHGRYWKCALIPMTFGRGTDLALSWDACRMWQPVDATQSDV